MSFIFSVWCWWLNLNHCHFKPHKFVICSRQMHILFHTFGANIYIYIYIYYIILNYIIIKYKILYYTILHHKLQIICYILYIIYWNYIFIVYIIYWKYILYIIYYVLYIIYYILNIKHNILYIIYCILYILYITNYIVWYHMNKIKILCFNMLWYILL